MIVAERPSNRLINFINKPGRDKAAAAVATLRRMLGDREIFHYVLTGGQRLSIDDARLTKNEALQYNIRSEIARLKAEIRVMMPENPVLSGYKVFSQVDEDGIIDHLLSRFPEGSLSRTAIEIGCGDGLENNTHLLLLEGYRVCWLDGALDKVTFIRQELGLSGEHNGRLMLRQSFVDLENISTLVGRFCEFLGTWEPDLFSLDIDGNDLHVLSRALDTIRPKIICVEYNAKFPPPLKLAIRYDAQHQWSGDDYHGASLQAFSDLLSGYFLACCNISGSNAFFVRNDFRSAFTVYPVADLFQPQRTHLRLLNSGHRPSLKWARNALESSGDIAMPC